MLALHSLCWVCNFSFASCSFALSLASSVSALTALASSLPLALSAVSLSSCSCDSAAFHRFWAASRSLCSLLELSCARQQFVSESPFSG